MAVPALTTYSVGVGQPIHAGNYPGGRLLGGVTLDVVAPAGTFDTQVSALSGDVVLSAVAPGGAGLQGIVTPAWASSATVGEWTQITSISLSSSGVGWSGTNPGGSGANNYAAVINAWGGGIVTTQGVYAGGSFRSGPAMVMWGGGHGDYYGNEIYALHLGADTPTWYRLTDPTIPAPTNVGADGSGNPVARHTYDSLVYVGDGGRNWLLSPGGIFRSTDIGSDGTARRFDLTGASAAWTARAAISACPQTTALETATGLVWGWPPSANTVTTYDINADTFTAVNFKSPSIGSNPTSDIDQTRGIWMILSSTGLQAFRTTSTANPYYTPSTTGTGPSTFGGFLWDSDLDAFIAWTGGKTVYTLTPPGSNPYQGGNAWTWSSTTPGTGATPPSGNVNGTYGRFAKVTAGIAKGYVLVNSATDGVYFYRTA